VDDVGLNDVSDYIPKVFRKQIHRDRDKLEPQRDVHEKVSCVQAHPRLGFEIAQAELREFESFDVTVQLLLERAELMRMSCVIIAEGIAECVYPQTNAREAQKL